MDEYPLTVKTYIHVYLYVFLFSITYFQLIHIHSSRFLLHYDRNGHMTFEAGPLWTSRRAVVVDIRLSES